MKTLLTLITLTAIASAAGRATPLEVLTHTAGEAGFLVNSHLVLGQKEAVLVDAQFTRSEAQALVQKIRKSGRALKSIFITHGHPDHYFGLEVIAREFPAAKIVATAAVVAEIKATGPDKLAYWKSIYKDDLANKIVVPQPLKADFLALEGEKLEIHELVSAGESEHPTVVYIPAVRALLSGDLAYNKVHLWLAEGRPEGWLKNLAQARTLGQIEKIFPGHGENSDEALLKENADYIQTVVAAAGRATSREGAKAEVLTKYSDYRLPVILDLSLQTLVPEKKPAQGKKP